MAGFLILFTIILLWISRPVTTPSPPGTAIMNVIRNPSATATELNTATPANGNITPTLSNLNNISQDAVVQISGTGGDGLRIRLDPGLSSQIMFIALENERFRIEDGPQDIDGYTWWYLISPENETRSGWGVADFLEVIEEP